jgi:hypothetical protein
MEANVKLSECGVSYVVGHGEARFYVTSEVARERRAVCAPMPEELTCDNLRLLHVKANLTCSFNLRLVCLLICD